VTHHGGSVSVTIRAQDNDPGDTVSIVALEDPGLPLGSTMANKVCDPVAGCRIATRTWSWSPNVLDVGRTLKVCFTAHDDSGCSGRNEYSQVACVDVEVQRPALWWESSGSVLEGEQVLAAPDCSIKKCLLVNSTLSTPDISLASTLPPGVSFSQACSRPGGDTRLCSKCFDIRTSLEHVGKDWTLCARASDGSGAAPIQRCFRVRVPRCQSCVRPGESVARFAKRLGLGFGENGWRSLWMSNANDRIDGSDICAVTGSTSGVCAVPLHTDPDAVEPSQRALVIGPTYTMADGDTIINIAAKFQTTVSALVALNADVGSGGSTRTGDSICVVPCSK